jgi:type VI protein secretion system component Hcp
VVDPIAVLVGPEPQKEKLMPTYMKVDKITGPMAKAPYKGWFDLKTWGQGLHHLIENEHAPKSPGSSRHDVNTELKEAYISMNRDAGSPLLVQLTNSGQTTNVTIAFVRLESGVSSELMRLKYKDALFSHYQIGKNSNEEHLTFVAQEMVMEINSH